MVGTASTRAPRWVSCRDNGSAYRSHHWRRRCRRLGISPRRTRAYRPRTNGKVERFIQTLTRRWAHGQIYGSSAERLAALPSWLRTYNYLRPHSSLNRQTPAQRLDALLGDNVVASHN